MDMSPVILRLFCTDTDVEIGLQQSEVSPLGTSILQLKKVVSISYLRDFTTYLLLLIVAGHSSFQAYASVTADTNHFQIDKAHSTQHMVRQTRKKAKIRILSYKIPR